MATEQTTPEYYIGLMSGTSIDGLDGVLMSITPQAQTKQESPSVPSAASSAASSSACTSSPTAAPAAALDQFAPPLSLQIIATVSQDWPAELKATLHQLCQRGSDAERIEPLSLAANAVASYEAQVVQQLLEKSGLPASAIMAIGSHGQTIRHCPDQGFSVQIDNGPLLAARTGIDAIVNFRAADIACGGQGAPLAQAFHQKVFARKQRSCFVLNLGGIANVSAFGKDCQLLTAFDTGPANTLLDYVCRDYLKISYDAHGEHARAGKVNAAALAQLLEHPYLARPFPKSTGREDFNADTFDFMLSPLAQQHQQAPEQLDLSTINDTLATLTEFTACTVIDAIEKIINTYASDMSPERDLFLCGGGASNDFLCERFNTLAAQRQLHLTMHNCEDFGVDAKYLEAQAFAYFAYCNVHGYCLNLGKSTGAQSSSILGCLCPAHDGYYVRSRR